MVFEEGWRRRRSLFDFKEILSDANERTRAYLWTSLIPPAPPRGWLYDIECGGNGCGGPAVVWPREPDKSDWGCWEEACWPEPTWTDRIAASISFRRCHHFTYFVTNFLYRNLSQKNFSFHFPISFAHWFISTKNLNDNFFDFFSL